MNICAFSIHLAFSIAIHFMIYTNRHKLFSFSSYYFHTDRCSQLLCEKVCWHCAEAPVITIATNVDISDWLYGLTRDIRSLQNQRSSCKTKPLTIDIRLTWGGSSACFWYVRGCNGSGIWERKWEGTEGGSPPHPLSPLLSVLGNRWKRREKRILYSTETWGPNAVTQTFKRDAGSEHY